MQTAVQAAEHVSAARRRRERRLRQWLRHERMALTEACHHTMSKPALMIKVVEAEKYSAPSGPKTERSETHDALGTDGRGGLSPT